MDSSIGAYGENLYCADHKVDILAEDGSTFARSVLICLIKKLHLLEIKLRDQNDYSFSFTVAVDWARFDRMKKEQHLEIGFEEFHLQLVDLLKQTLTRTMLLRLELSQSGCRMLFYEKSRIKLLIFLIIDLALTDQKEVISEMATSIKQLREGNYNMATQLRQIRDEAKENATQLTAMLTKHNRLKQSFSDNLKVIGDLLEKKLFDVTEKILNKLIDLNNNLVKLAKDVNHIKDGIKYRENVLSQTLFQLERFKLDNEQNYKVIDSLKIQIDLLKQQKNQDDQVLQQFQQSICKKDLDIEKLKEEKIELRKDVQEATVIIAEKTKAHNELAKDLVQANTMLVNFNKQYDMTANEVDRLRGIITAKDQALAERNILVQCIKDDFDVYRKEYTKEEITSLRQQIQRYKERIEELEKSNREAVKINGLLTKKLSSVDVMANTRPVQ